MDLMRHSEARLTANVYTDSAMLPLAEELKKVSVPSASLIASLKTGDFGVKLAKPGNLDGVTSFTQLVEQSEVVALCPSPALAERVGFEPTEPLRVRLISSQVR
jgi:hypothetical protein